MRIKNAKHVLISRTDNIGDVILALPMAKLLKQHNPTIKISFLVRDYAADVARLCPFVDNVISWDQLAKTSKKQAITFLQNERIDGVVHAYPKSIISGLMKQARIKYRVGSVRRLHHWLNCNVRIPLSYASLDQYEPLVNLNLLKCFKINAHVLTPAFFNEIYLRDKAPLPERFASVFDTDKFNLILHPFTNGHTREWPISQFNALIQELPADRIQILVTGSAKESEKIATHIVFKNSNVTNLAGQSTLNELVSIISHADGLIANSTGPLHLAGALGVRTLGLYPATHGLNPARWGALGPNVRYLTADPSCNSMRCKNENDCVCMESITVEQVRSVVMEWLD